MKDYFEHRLASLNTSRELNEFTLIIDKQRRIIKDRLKPLHGAIDNDRAKKYKDELNSLLVVRINTQTKLGEINRQARLNNKIINEQKKGYGDSFVLAASVLLDGATFNTIKQDAIGMMLATKKPDQKE